jgi:hypothetical protein
VDHGTEVSKFLLSKHDVHEVSTPCISEPAKGPPCTLIKFTYSYTIFLRSGDQSLRV